MSFIEQVKIAYGDTGAIDAFGRLRVASPEGLFDCQFTYDLQPLLYSPTTAEAGASVTHDTTNRQAVMTFDSTPTGGAAFMQTFDFFRYQPGKSQLVFLTFNCVEGVADCLKFAGISDGTNGIEFRLNGTTPQVAILSGTSTGNEFVDQSNWNLDRLNGAGGSANPSGLTLDVTKTQILVIDFQALYVGRVRIGFDIGGALVYVHQFVHANIDVAPYFQTANLPLRCGMTCTGTVSTTLNFVCSSIISEGGAEDSSGYAFTAGGAVTAGNGARTHILSVRPKTTFNAITNRVKYVLDDIMLVVTGNNPVYWELVLGQAISGTTTFDDVNATYSAFEFNTAGTISGSPTIVIASGYVAASAGSKNSISAKVSLRYPLTLDSAGVVRSLGTLSLLVTGIGSTVATRAAFNWHEIR